MSQSTLMTENELPEYIYQLFDLKLDKDALARPTRDVVIDIYTRFLDKSGLDWRKSPVPGVEPSLLILMTKWLRRIISRYDLKRYDSNFSEFNITDITNPVRKRTIMFLNAILLFKSELAQLADYGRECEMKRAEKDERRQILERELSNKRVLLEELAFKRGQLPDPKEREERIAAKQRELEIKKNASSVLVDKNAQIKKNIDRLNHAKQVELIAMQETKQRIEKDRRRQDLKTRLVERDQQLALLCQELKSLKDSKSFNLMEKQSKEQTLRLQIEKLQKANDDILKRARDLGKNTRDEIKRLETEEEEFRKEVDKYIDILEQDAASIIKKYEDSRTIVERVNTITTNYDRKLKELNGSPSDQTFIKRRA